MIEELGTIKAVDKDHIWVETMIKTTCGGCVANDHCGTGTVARALSPKTQTLIFRWSKHAEVGQQVKLGIPEEALLGASALMYMVPLIALVLSALLGQYALPYIELQSELWVVLFSFSTTALAFWKVRRMLQRDDKQIYQPRLLRILPAAKDRISSVDLG
ncbi:SoxR reducing system RseC family protein [Lacimicrobium alkaliphilum]|uniref:Sigma-E factor regulatory protein RseC n=1 Tax=Lacimicrobium alkaliphilum TaxID=1526571 RepID=A0ABQ1REZ4_9ALTE|nr:SoxR reducing system RseC family protein [Lacimicrobium alkaliphilum]GGD67596.1 sigma-E factor regulatory protein RseC [Lacimicrobium alkaliphilum]